MAEAIPTPQQQGSPPRAEKEIEPEWLSSTRLCIEVMEDYFDEVRGMAELRPFHDELFATYRDVLLDKLQPFALDLALHLFGRDPAVVRLSEQIHRERAEMKQE